MGRISAGFFSGFGAGFRLDSGRANFKTGPPAGWEVVAPQGSPTPASFWPLLQRPRPPNLRGYSLGLEVAHCTGSAAMDVTKPNNFERFAAVEVTRPSKFIGFGASDVTKPYKFIGFGAIDVTKP